MYYGEQEGMISRLGVRGHRIDEIATINALGALERSADFVGWVSGGKIRSKRDAAEDKVKADIRAHNNAHDSFDGAVRAKGRMNEGMELYTRNPLIVEDAAARGEDVGKYVSEAAANADVNLERAKDSIKSTNEALQPYKLAEEHSFELSLNG